ncbi:phosphoserine phosphatase SerB [Pseudohalocynthiibacter aestuariivivens]|nr:phosphoserine phosphatase SerB [Pseudohalocynthiibacter aestuariivivens]
MIAHLVVIGNDSRGGTGKANFVLALRTCPLVRVMSQDEIERDAWRIQCDDPQNTLNRSLIQQLANASGVDVYVSDAMPVRRKLLVADMEATIILNEMIDVLAAERGIGAEIAEITAQTMAGELDFEQSLVERTKRFAGTPEGLLKELCQQIRFAPGARALIQTMRASGALTVLATGGYDVFADVVAEHCGFDKVFANHPVIHDGFMTGELRRPIGTAYTKREVLLKCCAEADIVPEMACCVGDGANDLLMLQACGLPFSYRGKPVVRGFVDLDIRHGDLTAVLYAQGFRGSEILDG